VKLRAFLEDAGPMDEAKAWACLTANLLVLPGLGTFVTGRKSGLVQATLALLGFGLTLFSLTSFVMEWIRLRSLPEDGGPHLVWGILGIALFGAAWLWSLATGMAVVNDVRRRDSSDRRRS
jgi:hypothetical protein